MDSSKKHTDANLPGNFSIGCVADFEYPSHNRIDLPLEWVRCSVLIDSCRRLDLDPLDALEFLQKPTIRRGFVLIEGRDVSTGNERHFYLEATRGRSLPSFRLGFVDPVCHEFGIALFGPEFQQSVAGSIELGKVIRACLADRAEREADGLRLVVAPVGQYAEAAA